MGILDAKDKIIFRLPCFCFRFGGYTKELLCNFMFNLLSIVVKSRRILMMLKKLCMFLLCSSKYCSQVADGYEDDLLVPSSKDWWNNLREGLVLFNSYLSMSFIIPMHGWEFLRVLYPSLSMDCYRCRERERERVLGRSKRFCNSKFIKTHGYILVVLSKSSG